MGRGTEIVCVSVKTNRSERHDAGCVKNVVSACTSVIVGSDKFAYAGMTFIVFLDS